LAFTRRPLDWLSPLKLPPPLPFNGSKKCSRIKPKKGRSDNLPFLVYV
jgi:hypothetical protein